MKSCGGACVDNHGIRARRGAHARPLEEIGARFAIAVLGLGLAAAFALPASAQTYPDRPVTMVVGASPGGGTDVAARFLADPLSRALGKPIIVDNKPGVNGNIGTIQAARARPDGHTLLMQYSGGHVTNPHLLDNPGWELRNFAPVALVAFSPHVLAVRPGIPANDLAALADLARADPGTLRYGSAGNGSIQHLAMEIFARTTGTELLHVPYRSAAPAVTDLLGGRIDVVNTTPASLVAHIRAGTVKALAYTSGRRHPQLPDVPTSAESGLPGYEIATWFGVLAPAGTPPAAIARLAAEIKTIVEGEDFKRKMEEQGGLAAYAGPDEFHALIGKEYEHWGQVIRAAGIKADQQ